MKRNAWVSPKPSFGNHKKEVFLRAASVAGIVYQIGESELLRKPSKEVSISKIKFLEMQAKIKYLKKCLVNYTKLTGHGRGIAGVQVGIPEQFFAAYTSLDKKKIEIFINPKITKKSKKLLKYPEMCLSAAPIIVPLARPAWVEFEYWDDRGDKRSWEIKDDTKLGRMLNRVFQHEIDHLEGIINLDLVKSPKELILESDPNFYKKVKFEKI